MILTNEQVDEVLAWVLKQGGPEVVGDTVRLASLLATGFRRYGVSDDELAVILQDISRALHAQADEVRCEELWGRS